MDAHGLQGRWRSSLAPELLDQAFARDDLVVVEQQDRERRALLSPAKPDGSAGVDNLKRPEDPKLHLQPPPDASTGRSRSQGRRVYRAFIAPLDAPRRQGRAKEGL